MATLYEFVNTTHADGSVSASLQPAANTFYQNLEDLPPAAENHAKVAHVHSTGAMYFAHLGMWHRLISENVTDATIAGTLTVNGALTVDAPVTVESDLNASSGTLKINDQTEVNGRLEVDGPLKCDNLTIKTFPKPGERTNALAKVDGRNFYMMNNYGECVRLIYTGQNWIVTSAYNQTTQAEEGSIFPIRLGGEETPLTVETTPLAFSMLVTNGNLFWPQLYHSYYNYYNSLASSNTLYQTYANKYFHAMSLARDSFIYLEKADGQPVQLREITTNFDPTKAYRTTDTVLREITITQDMIDNRTDNSSYPFLFSSMEYSIPTWVYSSFIKHTVAVTPDNTMYAKDLTLSTGTTGNFMFQVPSTIGSAVFVQSVNGTWEYETHFALHEWQQTTQPTNNNPDATKASTSYWANGSFYGSDQDHMYASTSSPNEIALGTLTAGYWYRLTMSDSWGDGWNNNKWTIKAQLGIDAITTSNPAVVTTSTAHGLSTGRTVTLSGLSGDFATNLHGMEFTITVSSTTEFSLDSTDSSSYAAFSGTSYVYYPIEMSAIASHNGSVYIEDESYDDYVASHTSSGQVTVPDLSGYHGTLLDIAAITQDNPPVITTQTEHPFSAGDKVVLKYMAGMTELQNLQFDITYISPTEFSLDGVDATAYTAFTSGLVAKMGEYCVCLAFPYGDGTSTFTDDGEDIQLKVSLPETDHALKVYFHQGRYASSMEIECHDKDAISKLHKDGFTTNSTGGVQPAEIGEVAYPTVTYSVDSGAPEHGAEFKGEIGKYGLVQQRLNAIEGTVIKVPGGVQGKEITFKNSSNYPMLITSHDLSNGDALFVKNEASSYGYGYQLIVRRENNTLAHDHSELDEHQATAGTPSDDGDSSSSDSSSSDSSDSSGSSGSGSSDSDNSSDSNSGGGSSSRSSSSNRSSSDSSSSDSSSPFTKIKK